MNRFFSPKYVWYQNAIFDQRSFEKIEGFRPRDAQIQMAEAVDRAIADKSQLMLKQEQVPENLCLSGTCNQQQTQNHYFYRYQKPSGTALPKRFTAYQRVP